MRKDSVLIVDDDPQLQRLLRAQLLQLQYDVHVTDRGENGIRIAAEFEPDLILLALDLPGISGVETTRCLREWTRTPIIILNSKERSEGIVEALDSGADDSVAKPFAMAELLARMRAVLRRARDRVMPAPMTPLTARNLSLDRVNRRVLLDGRPLHLTPTEYDLLCVLATHAGRVLTHRELLTRVWGEASAADTQYLHVFISQLRRKLQRRPEAPRHIFTEPGIGYQFSAAP